MSVVDQQRAACRRPCGPTVAARRAGPRWRVRGHGDRLGAVGGAANAGELPSVPSVPSVVAGVDNAVARVSTQDAVVPVLPSNPLSDKLLPAAALPTNTLPTNTLPTGLHPADQHPADGPAGMHPAGHGAGQGRTPGEPARRRSRQGRPGCRTDRVGTTCRPAGTAFPGAGGHRGPGAGCDDGTAAVQPHFRPGHRADGCPHSPAGRRPAHAGTPRAAPVAAGRFPGLQRARRRHRFPRWCGWPAGSGPPRPRQRPRSGRHAEHATPRRGPRPAAGHVSRLTPARPSTRAIPP